MRQWGTTILAICMVLSLSLAAAAAGGNGEPPAGPKIVITAPEDGYHTNAGMIVVEGTVSDETGIVAFTVDDEDVPVKENGTFSAKVLLNEDDGNQTISVEATNVVGAKTVKELTVIIDRTPPIVKMIEPSENITLVWGQSTTFRLVGEPGLQVTYDVIAAPTAMRLFWAPLPGTFMEETENEMGVYEATYVAQRGDAFADATIHFFIIDKAGNRTDLEAAGLLTVVPSPALKSPIIVTPDDGAVMEESAITVAGTADRGVTVHVEIDKAAWQVQTTADNNGNWLVKTPLLRAGKYTIRAYVMDGDKRMWIESSVTIEAKHPDHIQGPTPPAFFTLPPLLVGGTEPFDASGGTVTAGSATVTVPAGLLQCPREATLTPAAIDEAPGDAFVTPLLPFVFHFEEVTGRAVYDRLLSITFQVEPTDLPSGVALANLGVFRYEAPMQRWLMLPTEHDAAAGKITGRFRRGDLFALADARHVPRFGDLAHHWAEVDILELASLHIITAAHDELFSPEAATTRAAFAEQAAKALGLAAGDAGDIDFIDLNGIPESARRYIAALVADGTMIGYSDARFGAADLLTREQLVSIVARALALDGGSVAFTDDDAVAPWARAAVRAAAAAGLIHGRGNGLFDPNAATTRAEAAKLLAQLVRLQSDASLGPTALCSPMP